MYPQRGALSEEEIALYDALADNESAKQVLGDKILQVMARELVNMVGKNVTIDWTLRDSVQAKLRSWLSIYSKNTATDRTNKKKPPLLVSIRLSYFVKAGQSHKIEELNFSLKK
jgi:hypothetical protein